jgi:hypothetical protein
MKEFDYGIMVVSKRLWKSANILVCSETHAFSRIAVICAPHERSPFGGRDSSIAFPVQGLPDCVTSEVATIHLISYGTAQYITAAVYLGKFLDMFRRYSFWKLEFHHAKCELSGAQDSTLMLVEPMVEFDGSLRTRGKYKGHQLRIMDPPLQLLRRFRDALEDPPKFSDLRHRFSSCEPTGFPIQ